MNKIAFIYPGQGAQKAGMGADFYEKSEKSHALYEKAGDMLDLDLKALCFEENDKLDLTEYTQAALVTTCLAMTGVVMEKGLKPDITAGLSLGEYAAISAAGGMDPLDAIRLVRKRGILMASTVPSGVGAMCAVMAMDSDKIEEVIKDIPDVTIANYNCPGQIVLTGKKEGVETAAENLKAAGAKRTVMLNVSGPFHSPLLKPAGDELAKALDEVVLHPLSVPYVTNVDASIVEEVDKTKDLLRRQVYSPVRWMQSMERIIEEGVDTFLEIGPGKTLAGFMRKINRDVKVYNIATWEDVEKVTGELC